MQRLTEPYFYQLVVEKLKTTFNPAKEEQIQTQYQYEFERILSTCARDSFSEDPNLHLNLPDEEEDT